MMNYFTHMLVVIGLLASMLFMCQAEGVRCGEAGTFMYPYHMTAAGSGGENTFPPCAWCDSSAGKWSDAFTPTASGTGCGCISGRYYAPGVDGSSFTCPLCPFGTYKNGISVVTTCMLTTSDVVAEPVSPVSELPNPDGKALVVAPVSEHPSSDIPARTSIPSWVIASLVGNGISVVVCAMVLIVCTKKHFYPIHSHEDLKIRLNGDIVILDENGPV
jgi:hypothetical protein